MNRFTFIWLSYIEKFDQKAELTDISMILSFLSQFDWRIGCSNYFAGDLDGMEAFQLKFVCVNLNCFMPSHGIIFLDYQEYVQSYGFWYCSWLWLIQYVFWCSSFCRLPFAHRITCYWVLCEGKRTSVLAALLLLCEKVALVH